MMRRFDVLKQGLWDGDSSTIFFQDKLMDIPKHYDFIPMESPGVMEAVNEALDKADELKTIFRNAL